MCFFFSLGQNIIQEVLWSGHHKSIIQKNPMFKLTQKRLMEKYIVIYLVVQRESKLLDFDYFGVIKQKKSFSVFHY